VSELAKVRDAIDYMNKCRHMAEHHKDRFTEAHKAARMAEQLLVKTIHESTGGKPVLYRGKEYRVDGHILSIEEFGGVLIDEQGSD
jgi:hypothetical protein